MNEMSIDILDFTRSSYMMPGMEVTWGDGSPKAVVRSVTNKGAEVELQVNLVTQDGQRFLEGSYHILPVKLLRIVN